MRFHRILAAELARRRARDRGYSLRRFARRLGVSHSTLSRILRGRRPLPARTVRELGNGIGLPPEEIASMIAREDEAAILGAIARSAFRPSSRWLAAVACISIDRVNIALQALLRQGALRMDSRDRWRLEGGVEE